MAGVAANAGVGCLPGGTATFLNASSSTARPPSLSAFAAHRTLSRRLPGIELPTEVDALFSSSTHSLSSPPDAFQPAHASKRPSLSSHLDRRLRAHLPDWICPTEYAVMCLSHSACIFLGWRALPSSSR